MTDTLGTSRDPRYNDARPEQSLSLDALEREITTLSANINAATWRLLRLIAEFDEREGYVAWGMRSCAHWLDWQCGIDLGAAREKVRVARSLEALAGRKHGIRTRRAQLLQGAGDDADCDTGERIRAPHDRPPRHGDAYGEAGARLPAGRAHRGIKTCPPAIPGTLSQLLPR